jgi:cell division protease FtsH
VFLKSREQFEDELVAVMGGRAAEEIIFSQFTTGASSDLQHATNRARQMIMQFGMSDALGPRTFGGGGGSLFLGRDLYEQRDYSERAAEEIDNEVKRIVQMSYQRAKHLLQEHQATLDLLAKVLIEQETLERAQFEELMNTQVPPTIDRGPEPSSAPKQPTPSVDVTPDATTPTLFTGDDLNSPSV